MVLFSRRRAFLVLGALVATHSILAAPTPPAAAIEQELRSFGTLGTVLHIGAHPDDENTQLITYLSLGRGYRAAYLSLTRGDGGQNELGRDFDEKLGVLRTQELLAARRLDHGRQFFTRAIDFGYSKTPEETLRFWDRTAVLGDVVRIYRQFRPDVVVTRFPVPPGSGGHGHHTASAMLAVEAFQLAGDPTAYPEQLAQGLTVWQPKRVVWNGFGGNRGGGLTGPTVQLDIAGTDPVTGGSFGTIANQSRGMHKTQGLGGFSGRTADGPNVQTFLLMAGEAAAADLMDGVDTTWARYPGGAEIGELAAAALAQFKDADPSASVPALLAIRTKVAALPADPLVDDKRAQLDLILQACLGLEVETTAAQAEFVPGDPVALRLRFTLSAHNTSVRYVQTTSPALKGSNYSAAVLIPGQPLEKNLSGVLLTNVALTQPYWLRADGTAGISRVEDPSLIGRPENPPAIPLAHTFEIGGQTLIIADEPVQLLPDAPAAQMRRRMSVIPPVSLQLNSQVFLIGPGRTRTVIVELSAARTFTRGKLRLETPAGWTVTPVDQDFSLTKIGETARFAFQVTAPAGPQPGWLKAVAAIGYDQFSNQRQELRYEHLPVQLLQPPARARLANFAFTTRGQTIGYLPGAGDSVAECLAQMGYVVHRLTGADLLPEKLQGLDAVVIGVRAFNERDDLKAAFPGLLAWVEAGGTAIAQYNRPNGLLADNLGPYALSIAGAAPALRVTDETAAVTLLAPDHAALNTPNKIGAADFNGWVQERGAYFPSSWDKDRYTALLAMNDPGEAPLESSILVAKYGKGHYVYTGIGFFRQLPAGVPGAYRLFANLVSLGK